MNSSLQYNRVLIKISGEALMGHNKFGIDVEAIEQICNDIVEVYKLGIQVCLVVGGGNICRGATISQIGIERASADYMGMLATGINAIAMQAKLEARGVITRVLSAIEMKSIAETYIRRKAIRHMEKKRIVIFSAGTGNPYFTTDTCAALRAAETNCDLIMKATQVDGVYCSDPKVNVDAKKYCELSYKEVLSNELNVMDAAAISLAKENKIPIVVFNIHSKGAMAEVINHRGEYTIIK